MDHSSSPSARKLQLGRLWRLVLKELREILRDRRTIITLVVMPLLIYPLLAVVFQRFLVTSLSVSQDIHYDIGVDSPIGRQMLVELLQVGDAALAHRVGGGSVERTNGDRGEGNKPDAEKRRPRLYPVAPPADKNPEVTIVDFPDANLERFVEDSSLHLAAVHRVERVNDGQKGLQTPLIWELIYREGSPTSEAALHYVESRLQAANEAGLNAELKRLAVSAELPAAVERRPISFSGAPVFSLAALIPLILVLMTVTGAVYPAIDLTAGERERGTLETLIAAPVPRLGLLFAKYIAVLAVALLTAVVNLIGMTLTAHSSGLAASLFGGGMSLGVVVKVLLLLALFAAFFSAILLALTSYARSFKEAQAYIIPLMLFCLVPGVLCLLPSLEFTGWMAVTPLVNIVMLARDLLEGSVHPGLALAAVGSTIFYIAAAIALAARIFGTDAILYGSPTTWSDLARRPSEERPAASLGAAMFCLAAMFPTFYVLANTLGRSAEFSIERQSVVRAIITAAIFGGIPAALALVGRVNWTSGLGIRKAGVLSYVAAAILGISTWPAAHELALACQGFAINPELLKKINELVAQFQTMPLWLVLVAFALVPAVFEEFCFRGFLFGAIRQRLSGPWTVLITAILFGFFHEVTIPGKLVPSAALGLALGWVRLRTGSILPGIVMHAALNSFLLAVTYYKDELAARGWGLQQTAHLPLAWHVLAVVGIGVGVGMLAVTKTRRAG
jgi:ABC-2 type transport system permease protein/sodium transport system permease protein